MGSYWAYYELGWGGWWFWDPVENASFMPWLAGTALLHSALVMEKREALKIWTVLLAILAFSLSLLGTFLVRSGVLTSVHAFASDPSRGVFILCILLIFIGGALSLFALRAPKLSAGGLFAPMSREGALVVNNLILTVACGTVLTGTLYPLLLETLTGDKISVGAPFFNLTFGLLMAPLVVIVPFGPMLAWKRGDLLGALQRLYVVAGLAFLAAVVFFYIATWRAGAFGARPRCRAVPGPRCRRRSLVPRRHRQGRGRSRLAPAFRPAALGLRHGPCPCRARRHRARHRAVTTFESEHVIEMKPGEVTEAGGYTLHFDGMQPATGPNYTEEPRPLHRSARAGVAVADTWSAKRLYTARQMPTTEAGILTFGLSQLYVSLGDATKDGGIVVRIWWKPLILCIWGGAVLMAFGGLVSLSDRRLRVGAPRRKAKPAAGANGAGGMMRRSASGSRYCC